MLFGLFLLLFSVTAISSNNIFDTLNEFNERNRAEAYQVYQYALQTAGLAKHQMPAEEPRKHTPRVQRLAELHGLPAAIPTIVERQKNNRNFNTIPMLLFAGPSGTGKTLAARVMAQEWGYEIEEIAGYDFAGKHIGDAKNGIAALFARLRATQKPTVLLVEELASLLGAQALEAHAEYQNAAKQFMREIADVSNRQILVIGTVHDIDDLPVNMRRQREIVEFGLPNADQRLAMINDFAARYHAFNNDGAGLNGLVRASHNLSAQDLTSVFELARREQDGSPARANLVQGLLAAFEKKRRERNDELKRLAARREALYVEVASPQKTAVDFAGGLPVKIRGLLAEFNQVGQNRVANEPYTRGLLLSGPAGTGKTTLAEAFAHEAGAKFMNIPTSALNKVGMGSGAERVQSLFKQAKKYLEQNPQEKVVMFFDEIDSLGKKDDHSEYAVTINALKIELTAIDDNPNIFVIGATNHKDDLSPELIRSGRFDTHIEMALPNAAQRSAILRHYLPANYREISEQLPDGSPSLVGMLMQRTNEFTSADLKALVAKAMVVRRANNLDQPLGPEHFVPVFDEHDKARKARMKELLPFLDDDPSHAIRNIIGAPQEAHDCIRNLRQLATIGRGASHGLLLYGPPGTGKTSIAKAIAQESGLLWVYVIGSHFDDLVEGPKKIQETFEQLRLLKRRVVLIVDEIDTIGTKAQILADRNAANVAKTFWNELSEAKNANIFVIGITNLFEEIDDAMKRSGRFDYHVQVGMPDEALRAALINHYWLTEAGFTPAAESLPRLTKMTENMTGADIKAFTLKARDNGVSAAQRENRQGEQADHFAWYFERLINEKAEEDKKREVKELADIGVEFQKSDKKMRDVVGDVDAKIQYLIRIFKSGRNNFGDRVEQGLLLHGPPGTGKTLMAKAFAGECGARFISVAASSFADKYQGEGPRKIRKLFQTVKKEAELNNEKIVIFIDEIESLVPHRGNDGSNADDARMISELLKQLTDIEPLSDKVFIIAATNCYDQLDRAVIRPERFSTHIKVDLPYPLSRAMILSHYLAGKRHSLGGSALYCSNGQRSLMGWLASETEGFSGAELRALTRRAADRATELNAEIITEQHFRDVLPQAKTDFAESRKRKKKLQEEQFEWQKAESDRQRAFAERQAADSRKVQMRATWGPFGAMYDRWKG